MTTSCRSYYSHRSSYSHRLLTFALACVLAVSAFAAWTPLLAHAQDTAEDRPATVYARPDGIVEDVHPDMDPDELFQQVTQARDLVHSELWELVDYVVPQSTVMSER